MPRPMTTVETATRVILMRAVQGLPASQRGWGQAMLAELEEIPDPREAVSWALGALWVVWMRRQRAWWREAWRFATDWSAWRAQPIAPVPVPVWVLVSVAVFFGLVAAFYGPPGPYGGGVVGAMGGAALALNLAGRVEASLRPHPLYTRRLPRGDVVDRDRLCPWVGWPVTVLVTAGLAVAEAVHFTRYGQFFPFLEIYTTYWVVVWSQAAARITLRRHGWQDPRAQSPAQGA